MRVKAGEQTNKAECGRAVEDKRQSSHLKNTKTNKILQGFSELVSFYVSAKEQQTGKVLAGKT